MDHSLLSRKQLKWIGWFCLSAVIPLLLVVGVTIAGGIVDVVATGQCPAAPPDITPYSCSVGDYLARMLFGFWALMGIMILGIGWLIVDIGLWLVGWGGWTVLKRLRYRNR
ncbi:MAG: hypothetical protein AAGA75_13700 [Cyanobacteria bacterium P01_E01_bin.6]